MPEKLILVPPSRWILNDAQEIDPRTYPKQNTPADMLAWADDLARVHRVIEEDSGLPPGQRRSDRWRATDRSRLPPDVRRLVVAHDKFYVDHAEAIRGSLRADGSLDLANGRHRAHYLIQRNEPVPVFVAARDPGELQRFDDACRAGLDRTRPELVRGIGRTATRGAGVERPSTGELGRIAVENTSDGMRSPEYRTAGEKKVIREGGVPLREDKSPSRSRERY